MKPLTIILSILTTALLISCSDDVASAGAGALTDDEEVRVRSGVLTGMQSSTDSLSDFVITQTPDSFLLGEVNTAVWATIKADLMTQFACPTGFVYPEGSQIDSIFFMMTYTSWFAEGNSPLRISVYELDLQTFDYEQPYTSSEDVYAYWSGDKDKTHVVVDDQVVVAAKPNDSIYSSTESKYYPVIRFKMTDQFVAKMNSIKTFPSQNEFNEFFKGLYITTTWGASTALYVDNLTMVLYYHYPYTTKTSAGTDTLVIETDAKSLYANSEVRQINRYSFPNKNQVVQQMQAMEESVNFVVSPSYVYTVLHLPLSQYVDTIVSAMIRPNDTLQPYINKALMRVEVLNEKNTSSSSDKWADPASYMLLIRKDSLQSFFDNHKLPSADYCVLAAYSLSLDSNYNYSYHYDFDVSTLLYNEIHRTMRQESTTDLLDMVMIPVNVEYTTTTSSSGTSVVSQVKINQTITYTEIQSAQFLSDPLDIDVVFSGFSINSIH